MTCPICKQPYARIEAPTPTGHTVTYRKRCRCKRPMAKVKPDRCYDIRDLWRDEVMR